MKVSDLSSQNVSQTTISGSPDISTILQQSQPSTFRKVLGGVVGGATNMVAPGLGSVLGSAISGSAGSGLDSISGLSAGSDPSQFLALQQQIEQQQEAYESASNTLKAKHDAMMAAIQNLH